MTSLSDRKCLECAIAFKGRSDKKFCSDQCRTSYHNRLHPKGADVVVKNVDRILKRNRRILTTLNPAGRRKIAIEKLMTLGFNFNYFTSVRTKGGTKYYYCYDQGYIPLKKDSCLLIIHKTILPDHSQ